MSEEAMASPPEQPKKSVVREDAQSVDLGPLPQYFGYYFRRLQQAHKKHFMAMAASTDIRPKDVGALYVLGMNPGLTPTALSSALSLDAAQVTNLLKDYEFRGLIRRETSSTDGRSRAVFLTADGEARLEALRAMIDEIDASFVTPALTPAERTELLRLLARVLAAHEPE